MKVVMKIGYDGSAFGGFQRLSAGKSVQGTLESTLSQVLNHPVSLSGAGRTDLGVHGTGQVICFTSGERRDLGRLVRSVNSLLLDPVAIIEAVLLDDDDPFHPRFSALSRSYSYFVLDGCGPRDQAFWSNRAWCLPQRLDLEKARQTADLFLGEQDFTTYSYRMQDMETCVRQVTRVEISVEPAPAIFSPAGGPRLLRLTITANGFLRRMVRLIAASVAETASGFRTVDNTAKRLQARDAGRAPHPAPAQGLYLEQIEYDPDPFDRYRGTPRHVLASFKSRHRIKP